MAVDWGTLIGSKTTEQLVQTFLERWVGTSGVSISNMNVGGVFRTLGELCMQAVADLHALVVQVLPQGFAATATGVWLDAAVRDVVQRLAAVKTQGLIRYGRSGTSGNIIIPAGTFVTTRASVSGEVLRFRVLADTLLADGASQVLVAHEAENTGWKYNVAPGQICELQTHVAGIESVLNLDDWITRIGVDEETDKALYQRYQLAWRGQGSGGNADDYVFWARSVAGVGTVVVLDQHPRGQGTVDVVLTGLDGPPAQQLIQDVADAIAAKRPQCTDVVVRGPTARCVTLALTVTLPATLGDADVVRAAVAARGRSLLSTGELAAVLRLGVGRTLYLARLVGLAMDVAPVEDAVVTNLAGNLVAGPDEWITLAGDVQVTVVRAG